MIWYDMIWYDMIWYDMIWYDKHNIAAQGPNCVIKTNTKNTMQISNSESHAEQTGDQGHIFQVHLYARHTHNPTLFYKKFSEYSPESGIVSEREWGMPNDIGVLNYRSYVATIHSN